MTTAQDGKLDVDPRTPALQIWLEHEDRLFGLAYRLLGSVTDAQDVLQDAWVRLERIDVQELRDPTAWMTTVVTRLCLNALDSARTRRETYVGPWLPEPVATDPDPAADAMMAESISAAFLVVLEVLSPAERVAFVLHDVFGHPFTDVARIMGREEAACRQLASRARRAVRARRPRYTVDPDQRRMVNERFIAACVGRDVKDLLDILAPDVTLHNDGGGRVRAARRVIVGSDRATRFLVGVLTRRNDWHPFPLQIHGAPGLAWVDNDHVAAVLSATADDHGQITTINLVVNPDKLRHMAPTVADRDHPAGERSAFAGRATTRPPGPARDGSR